MENPIESDYIFADKMVKEYLEDIVKRHNCFINQYQLKTYEVLLEFRNSKEPKKISFWQKLLGAFKNRKN